MSISANLRHVFQMFLVCYQNVWGKDTVYALVFKVFGKMGLLQEKKFLITFSSLRERTS